MVVPPVRPDVHLDPRTGKLTGDGVSESRRTLTGLAGYFLDEPAPEGVAGAICCATTFLQPGPLVFVS